jgi:hypothetical protein
VQPVPSTGQVAVHICFRVPGTDPASRRRPRSARRGCRCTRTASAHRVAGCHHCGTCDRARRAAWRRVDW